MVMLSLAARPPCSVLDGWGGDAMKTLGCIGAFVLCVGMIGQPRSAHTFAPIGPAAEELAYISAFVVQGGPGAVPTQLPPLLDFAPVIVDADGGTHVIWLPYTFSLYSRPEWSPDGRHVLNVRDGEIYLSPATGAPVVNLTNLPGASDFLPDWSPDGTKIAFSSNRDGPNRIYLMNVDGSAVVRLETGTDVATAPSWSPDGTRLAFNCARVLGPPVHVCVIGADGSGFARLTGDETSDRDPAWSPDGRTIVFSTSRYGGQDLAVMNPDGSGVTRVTQGVAASAPDWSSDGRRIAFVDHTTYYDSYGWSSVAVINADGTNLIQLGLGHAPSWRPWTGGVNDRPRASFTYQCVQGACTFDASSSSDSDGSIASYGWQINGVLADGVSASHTFVPNYTYYAQLWVMDDRGALAALTQIVDLTTPPVVSFTATCNGLTCAFDASATHDPDGLALLMWTFGDGGSSGSMTTTHTYAAPGTYTVTLTAADTRGGRASQSQTITVVGGPESMHVGDLDGASTGQQAWTATATITIHDSSHASLADAIVSGQWDDGTLAACTTTGNGRCSVASPRIPRTTTSVRFTITNVMRPGSAFNPAGTHDPDGDSSGGSITIVRK
jgi:PKD repeat protein